MDELARGLKALSLTDAGRWLRFQPDKPESGVVSTAREAVKALRGVLTNRMPFAPCSCKTPKTCEACYGMGWVTEGVLT